MTFGESYLAALRNFSSTLITPEMFDSDCTTDRCESGLGTLNYTCPICVVI